MCHFVSFGPQRVKADFKTMLIFREEYCFHIFQVYCFSDEEIAMCLPVQDRFATDDLLFPLR